jgi:transposase
MSNDPNEELLHEVEALRAHVSTLRSQLGERDSRIAQLEEWVQLLRHARFGRTSEKISKDQLGLFNEAEQDAAAAEPEPVEDLAPAPEPPARKRRPGRRPLPEWMERIEILHDLPESEKVCPHDGATLVEMGRESSEQLELVPAQVRVLRHVRPKYACPTCKEGVKIAAVPAQPIPKSLASPSLLAYVAVSKYADALPLYRLEGMLQRGGVDLARATLAHWMVRCAELVQPLVNLLREEMLRFGVLQCDETRFPVLKEPGKLPTSDAYLWALRGGPGEAPIVLYTYDPSRSGEVPKRLLEGFSGVLQTDGYEGYTAACAKYQLVHAGCWAHARRKFDEAVKAQSTGSRGKRKAQGNASTALQALDYIRKLYAIERAAAELSCEERSRRRAEHAKPLLEQIRTWLDAALARVPPSGMTGRALAYLAKQWPKLV